MQEKNPSLEQLWLECLHLTLAKIDKTILNVDRVNVQLILDLRLPCATAESAVLKQIRQTIRQKDVLLDFDDENDYFMLNQLQDKSVYANLFNDFVLNNIDLFQYYLHDQFLLFTIEHNIHLTINFVLQLINSNPKLSKLSQLKHLLIDHEELLQLLNIFEKGCQSNVGGYRRVQEKLLARAKNSIGCAEG